MRHVAVFCELPRFAARGMRVHRALMGALRTLKVKNASAEVFLVSDGAMRLVNTRTRGLRRPATVLSFQAKSRFPRPDVPRGGRYLGEIYLAPDHIARRGERIEPLAIHGLLHLLGYTHDRHRDTIEMERIEGKLEGLI
ncbi:MAG: rRNA maturation RNase YbeY [Candidatus Jorgensenbacteria bacterium]